MSTNEPTSAVIEVAYDGEALRAGVMDVRDLAPALLAVGELFQQANRVLNANRATIGVSVRAEFRRGSFEVSLHVAQIVDALEQTRSFLLGDDFKAAKELVALLFGVGGLYKFYKRLRGNKPTNAVPLPNGDVRIEIGAINFVISADVARLYNDPFVHDIVSGPLKPLEREGIDSFQVRDPDQALPLETVRKDELNAFKIQPTQEVLIADEPPRSVVAEIITLSFEDRYKWRFSDGGAIFTADIEDDEFFGRLQRREVSFSKGDVLRVQIKTRTWRTDKGLRSEYKVLKVLEVIPAPQQLPLLPSVPNRGEPHRNIAPLT